MRGGNDETIIALLTEIRDLLKSQRSEQTTATTTTSTTSTTTPLVEELSSLFYGNRQEAAMYVEQITNRPDREITDITNAKTHKGVLSCRMCGAPLYKILQRYGYYRASQKTWYSQVKIKR